MKFLDKVAPVHCVAAYTVYVCFHAVTPRRAPYIMFSHYNEALKAINLDGTNEGNLLPISPEIRPSKFDFDIRFVVLRQR